MVLVRMVFQTGWGKADTVAAQLVAFHRELGQDLGDAYGRTRILTDLSGPFHTVVQEIEVESLAAWERDRGKAVAHPKFRELQAVTQGMFESGRTEFYNIEN